MSATDAHAHRALRDVLGRFPTGVTVITALALPERRPIGLTVNSFSSVSLDPPLALWSLSRRSSNLEQFPVGKPHVIHILSEQQAAMALQFANSRIEKFDGVDHQPDAACGAPAIEGCVARLFCDVATVADGGDHRVIISRILRHEITDRAPLVFYRGRFMGLGQASPQDKPAL